MPAIRQSLSELRQTLALALPIIGGSVSQILMGLTDSAMVGHVGKVPLAASAFAGSVFGVFFVAGIGLLAPVSVLVARAHGAGRPEECARWLRHGLAVAMAMGVGLALLLTGLSTELHRFGQPAEVVAAANPFFVIIAVSLIPTFLFQVLRQFSEALGQPWQPMIILFLSVGLNALFDWVLIFGHLGAPERAVALELATSPARNRNHAAPARSLRQSGVAAFPRDVPDWRAGGRAASF
jgi:MATE family multidrug resistance protein